MAAGLAKERGKDGEVHQDCRQEVGETKKNNEDDFSLC
jgi:hypothetical protein